MKLRHVKTHDRTDAERAERVAAVVTGILAAVFITGCSVKYFKAQVEAEDVSIGKAEAAQSSASACAEAGNNTNTNNKE